MKWPSPPGWKDVERVWSYFAYLASYGFQVRVSEMVFKDVRTTIRSFDERFLTWPRTREERRKRVAEFTDQVVASVLNLKPTRDNLVDLQHLFQQPYYQAISQAAQVRIGDASDAEHFITADAFAFPVFMHAFVELIGADSIQQFRMVKWNEFYDAWDNRADAQIVLLKEHRRRLHLDSQAYLPIHQIQELIQQHVQHTESTIRSQGGSNKPLFPWPVR